MPTAHRNPARPRALAAGTPLALCLVAVSPMHAALAQETAPPLPRASAEDERATAPWRLGGFVGAAHNSPTGFIGMTPGRDHLFVGLQAVTPVLRIGPLRFNYAMQVLPLVLITDDDRPPRQSPYTRPGPPPGKPHRAYAYGLSPFGFELDTPTSRRVALYGAAAAGGLIFSRPFPVPQGTRINFTLEYGGGVLARVGRARWLRLGYKYHHLSNAYTGVMNPGLDGNVYYGGYEQAIRLPR